MGAQAWLWRYAWVGGWWMGWATSSCLGWVGGVALGEGWCEGLDMKESGEERWLMGDVRDGIGGAMVMLV